MEAISSIDAASRVTILLSQGEGLCDVRAAVGPYRDPSPLLQVLVRS
jgi:hypothetical protein